MQTKKGHWFAERQLMDRKDKTERRAQDIYLGDDAVYMDGLSVLKDKL
jgi:hypothetical protein